MRTKLLDLLWLGHTSTSFFLQSEPSPMKNETLFLPNGPQNWVQMSSLDMFEINSSPRKRGNSKKKETQN